MNVFARYLDQAEVSLGDLGRRAVDSVTIPVKIKSQEVISDLTERVTATIRAVAIRAALAAFAAVMAIIALAYALSGLHAYLARLMGPIEATLTMAGVFALLAIIAVIAIMVWPRPSGPAKRAAAAGKRNAEKVVAQARREAQAADLRVDKATAAPVGEEPADVTVDMKSGLGAIASALGEAGFHREQAGLRAGLALAEQLRPMQLVSLALIGGFVAGVRLTRRR